LSYWFTQSRQAAKKQYLEPPNTPTTPKRDFLTNFIQLVIDLRFSLRLGAFA